jgi:hypothetical protein
MESKDNLGRKSKEGLIMIPNINKQIMNKVKSNPDVDISSKVVQDIFKSVETKEATASGGSGQYSAPLFGDMKEDDNQKSTDLTFYKSKYNSDDNSFTAAYKIIDDTSEKVIEVMNIQEIEDLKRMFASGKKPYTIRIFKFKLPISQITILDENTGFEGFKFIKIPYWLVKKNPEQYKIIRINGSKLLDNKYNFKDNNLLGKVDDDVVEYIKTTDGEKESMRKIKRQQDGEITKAETKEATGSGSSGSYETPAAWAKSSTKKNWRGARKTQIPGGKFVEVKKKCQKFPYCNQGDIKALNFFENERIDEVIKNISKKHNISENVIKNILRYELDVFRKYKK